MLELIINKMQKVSHEAKGKIYPFPVCRGMAPDAHAPGNSSRQRNSSHRFECQMGKTWCPLDMLMLIAKICLKAASDTSIYLL